MTGPADPETPTGSQTPFDAYLGGRTNEREFDDAFRTGVPPAVVGAVLASTHQVVTDQQKRRRMGTHIIQLAGGHARDSVVKFAASVSASGRPDELEIAGGYQGLTSYDLKSIVGGISGEIQEPAVRTTLADQLGQQMTRALNTGPGTPVDFTQTIMRQREILTRCLRMGTPAPRA